MIWSNCHSCKRCGRIVSGRAHHHNNKCKGKNK